MSRWIDISVPLDTRTLAWPGDRPFELKRDCSLANGGECNLSSFAMSAHLGTHLDSPLHYVAGGASLDSLPFDAVIGPARVLSLDDLEAQPVQPGERILLKTRNSDTEWWTEPFRDNYAHLSLAQARSLADRGIHLIGIDYLSIGGPGESGAEVHRVLLNAGVWILESLNLCGVEPGVYEIVCLPLRIAGIEGSPARAILRRT
jgi:arylformamidase